MCHSARTGWVEIENLSSVSDLRSDDTSLVWGEADMTDLDPHDVDTMAEEFELDSLAVQDALRARQRPKLELYDTHRFVVLHQLYERDDHLEKRQVSCFVGDDYLLVIHEGAHDLLAEARARLSRSSQDARKPLYLLYVLLDAVVDEYQTIADSLEDAIERIEDTVVGAARDRVQAGATRSNHREDRRIQLQLYSVKQQIARLRRYALPLERVLDPLVGQHGKEPFPKSSLRLFRDVHDHTLRIADQVRNVDAIAQAVLDLNRAERSQDLNQVNKKLTGWAAIFAVPTVIAGIYGMNYRLFPADGTALGFWFALAVMVVAAGFLYLYFKNKEWL